MENTQNTLSRIHALAEGAWAAQLLFTAHDSGVFSLLEHPATAATLASQMDWNPRATRALLEALASIGLVECIEGRYRNTPLADECLIPGRESYQGNFLRHMQRTNEAWEQLGTALQTGRGIKQGRHPAGSEALREFALGMANLARMNAPLIARQLDLSPFRSMLDLGAGVGEYSRAFLTAWPHLNTTLFDVPTVIEMARDAFVHTGLAPRCHFLAGDFLSDSLGGPYDLLWMANVVHALGEQEVQKLLGRCFNALRPGGVLMIKDFLPDELNTSFCALFSLNLLLHTDSGRLYSVEEMAEWTQHAGFTNGQLIRAGEKARIWRVQGPK